MKIAGLLRRIGSLIVNACAPERIILFGSYAKGMENLESDLDILVVGDFPSSQELLRQELRQLLYGLPLPIDLHVTNLQELAAAAEQPYSFLSSVLESGKVIYSREEHTKLLDGFVSSQ